MNESLAGGLYNCFCILSGYILTLDMVLCSNVSFLLYSQVNQNVRLANVTIHLKLTLCYLSTEYCYVLLFKTTGCV